ncbi:MAG: SRPBCC family protein [Chloroflexi bacterium]|nr:SRPBCC family protein [Chloroflexota bacterium]
MATIEKSISINSPVDRVFGYFETPDFLQKCVPSLVEVKVWEPLPSGGHRFQCVHQKGGRRFDAELVAQTDIAGTFFIALGYLTPLKYLQEKERRQVSLII